MKIRFPRAFTHCTSCSLHKTRRNIVLGAGDVPCEVMFIGEAPGLSEDVLGVPFIGASGKLLRSAIADSGAKCRIYFTNVLACHPPGDDGETNRKPTPSEIGTCLPRLLYTYFALRPQRVILLGETAKRYTLFHWPDASCLPHPAYVLRKGGVGSPYYRAFVVDLWSAMQRLPEEASS
jgi:DNA polymerase